MKKGWFDWNKRKVINYDKSLFLNFVLGKKIYLKRELEFRISKTKKKASGDFWKTKILTVFFHFFVLNFYLIINPTKDYIPKIGQVII
jgi:hypothetical protein